MRFCAALGAILILMKIERKCSCAHSSDLPNLSLTLNIYPQCVLDQSPLSDSGDQETAGNSGNDLFGSVESD